MQECMAMLSTSMLSAPAAEPDFGGHEEVCDLMLAAAAACADIDGCVEVCGICDASEDESETTVICGEGLVKFVELVTAQDNGCRPEECADGRGSDGFCLVAEEVLTEEEAAELEDAEVLAWEDYGLEGCAEINLGTCDKDGVLYCYNTVAGWEECPGQPTFGGCEHDPDDPLSLTGFGQIAGQEPRVVLAAGDWTAVICLEGNDLFDGQASHFSMYLMPVAADGSYVYERSITLAKAEAVIEGEWRQEFTVESETVYEVWVTPEGDGRWTLRLSNA